jgi:lipopolysaccharide/colanic/teichoic acid biosynthesis glycosyltransferase
MLTASPMLRSPAAANPASPGLPRAVDAVAAAAGLLLSLPVLAVAAVAVAASSRGPVLFRQERVGRNGRRFRLFKLRTMRQGAGGPQVTAAGDDRITPVGRFLRRCKLDELPQLWNVVRGDMSLVGPRPEVPRYVDESDPRWKRVLQVRPGITDPVTLRLRDEEELLASAPGDPERFYREELQPVKLREYERYLEHRSWKTDLRVLTDTLRALATPRRRTAARGGRH